MKTVLRRYKHKQQDHDFSFFLCFREKEIPLRHNTSTMFTTHGYFWPVKTLDPNYLASKQFGMLGWFMLVLVLFRRISFSLCFASPVKFRQALDFTAVSNTVASFTCGFFLCPRPTVGELNDCFVWLSQIYFLYIKIESKVFDIEDCSSVCIRLSTVDVWRTTTYIAPEKFGFTP